LKARIQQVFEKHRIDFFVFFLLLILPLIVHWNVFFSLGPFPRIYPSGNDFFSSYLLLSLNTQLLSEGEIGLWFQGVGFGWPFFSHMLSGVLYPPVIMLSALNDPSQGLLFSRFITYVFLTKGITSCFFYLLARNLKITIWGALIGAIAWGFNLRFDDILRTPGAAHTIMWLPLLVLVAVKIMKDSNKRAAACFAILLAVTYFAGYPPHFVYSMGFIGLFFCFLLAENYMGGDKGGNGASALYLPLAVAFGTCLMAVKLLPELEFASLGNRSVGLPFAGTMIYRCSPTQTVLGYFVPAITYTERDHYLGILPLLLAIVGLLSRDQRYRFKPLLVFTVILTAIYSTKSIVSYPLQKFLYDYVPLFNSLRCPGRSFILSMFCLSLLAAYGMDALTSVNSVRRNVKRSVVIVASILLSGCAAVWLAPGLENLTKTDKTFFWISAVASAAIAALLFLPHLTDRGRSRLVPYLAICLALVDLSYSTHWKQQNPNARHHYFATTDPNIIAPKSLIYNRVNEKYIHIPSGELERIGRIDTLHNQPLLFVDSALPSSAAPFNEYGYEGSLLDVNRLFIKIRDSARTRSILNTRFDVEYFLPRAFVVYHVEKLPRERIIEEMASSRFDPLNTHYIEEELPEVFKELLSKQNDIIPGEASRLAQITDQTNILIYENRIVEIEVDIPKPGFLYLNEAFYPGWKAFVDGEPSKIYRTNYAFRGLPVPEGKHTITFAYRPARFYFGLLISGAALIVVLVVLVWSRGYIEAIGVALLCLFCYGPLAMPRTQANTVHPRKSITAYHVQTVEGKVGHARPLGSRIVEARVYVEEDGIYDLLLKSPPQFYQLNINYEFGARIFNAGSESPAPKEDWWEVQAILKLKKGSHVIEFIPIEPTRRMMPGFNKLIPRPDHQDVYDVEAIKIDRTLRVRRVKLVKH
jgi:hypothetical protein